MHKILIYLYIIHLLKSSTGFEHYTAHLQEVYVVNLQDQTTNTLPEAAYIQLRCRPPDDEQGNARNMQRILINLFIH